MTRRQALCCAQVTRRGRTGLSRVALVSFAGVLSPESPRAVRTAAIGQVLERICEVEYAGVPRTRQHDERRPKRFSARLKRLHPWLVTDRYELLAHRRFRAWSPEAEAAILIGYPFSPLAAAARILRKREIPYIVDVGDPWAVANPMPVLRGPALVRARVSERHLMGGSAGVVLTTTGQANQLAASFPGLPRLVQANGLTVPDPPMPFSDPRPPLGGTLRLAHFGQVHSARISIAPHLEKLTDSGRFSGVELHLYGATDTRFMRYESRQIRVIWTPLRSLWERAIGEVQAYDAAFVVGNRISTSYRARSWTTARCQCLASRS